MSITDETVIGVDVGGANLKVALLPDTTLSRPFPLWQSPNRLGEELASCLSRLGVNCPDHLAVTMTGELADCFPTRRSGVRHIVQQVRTLASHTAPLFYSVDGCWLTSQEACARPWDVAASNWHALAQWVASEISSDEGTSDLLIDIGSTTADVVPVQGGKVQTAARTDRDRLQAGQLIYTGLERTPVSAILRQVELNGTACPLMAERFAESIDAYLVLDLCDEQVDNHETADGRARTRLNARARLARMVGEDSETLASTDVEQIAEQVIAAQTSQILAGISKNLDKPATHQRVIFSGHGRPLFDRIQTALVQSGFAGEFLRLSDLLGNNRSRCAPAYAAASLLCLELENTLERDS